MIAEGFFPEKFSARIEPPREALGGVLVAARWIIRVNPELTRLLVFEHAILSKYLMPSYIPLVNNTDQGIMNFKDCEC